MEMLVCVLFVIIIILLISQNNKLISQIQRLANEIKQLKNEFRQKPTTTIVDEIKKEESKTTIVNVSIPTIITEEIIIPKVEVHINNVDGEPTITVQPQPESKEQISVQEYTAKNTVPLIPKQSFFERHPDMEKFIGENLVSKIGIAILVLAIGFFVKYAIDQQWIGPTARVGIGILCGAILIGIAHKLRYTYKSFSSILAGGGLAVFYFTITLGYHQFKLFDQTTAFVIMLVITVFAVSLSILYNKQELAIIALVGGFIAPFLVSSGSGNYKTLFIYLIMLNTGIVCIAFKKAWRLLNLLCFIFTVVLFGSWIIALPFDEPIVTYKNAFLFATIFYLLFFATNIAYNVSQKKKFIASDFGILLANTALYVGVGLYCIMQLTMPNVKGIFSAAVGLFNLVATFLLFKKQKIDTNILYLLIGITLTCISITAPLQLDGNYITLFWASEAALLYWLYTKATFKIIQIASVVVWVLMLVSLLIDWANVYGSYNEVVKIIVNKAFITSVVASIATYIMYKIKMHEQPEVTSTILIPNKQLYKISALLLLLIGGCLEIKYQFNYYYPFTNIAIVYLFLYVFIFILGYVFVQKTIFKTPLQQPASVILLCIIILLFILAMPTIFTTQTNLLVSSINNNLFLVQYVVAILAAITLYSVIGMVKKMSIKQPNKQLYTWLFCIVIVILCSAEGHLLANQIFYDSSNNLASIHQTYIKTGLPILWSICSFIFMYVGMRFKNKTLRIISLSLFTITVLKLFLFDIRGISPAGKIAAFFCLGVLLLVVSFMYQRLKKIIIDDISANTNASSNE